MCESNVFIITGGRKEKLMDEAVMVKVDGQTVIVEGVFGERREVKGKIIEVDAEKHEILISSDDKIQP